MQHNDLLFLILSKFKQSNGYAEMGEEKLRTIIKNFLTVKYKKEMDDALTRLNKKRSKGIKITDEDYEKEQMTVEGNVIYAAQMLAANTPEELENLI